ncbi:F0F1 ATP synthase subunit delta [Aquaspirillum sp. LM1]|jgi:F-type H+-transporting ATPase subunit delta|uniref:F0F1 ATP synthase subunit delta n=1 Tax=Aquaspirillum sp. LM1 TaxID=1938604 RepID=UPI000983FA90|nr:F0F1 ATP synthase subunit delta [Aquaspirillum sp. LM1]AQR66167.1 F0F1 ATP synthase subunit delta [Aquaspirillum sp. LM1]
MAEIITVARPYAEAVFRLAKDEKRLLPWGDALTILAAMMENSDAVTYVTHPKRTAQEAEKLIVDVLGDRADSEVKNFIAVLLENHRLTLLPEIARQFELLKSREESVVEATVESAFPLNDAQAAELATTLKAQFGKDIRLSTSVDPNLIGGVRIKVGDEVIDASVRGKLQAMAVSLKS